MNRAPGMTELAGLLDDARIEVERVQDYMAHHAEDDPVEVARLEMLQLRLLRAALLAREVAR